jgi:hypothetical protein
LVASGRCVEVDHLRLEAGARVARGDTFAIGRARLVEELEACGVEMAERFDHAFVELVRALAAADDENAERRCGSASRRCVRERVEQTAAQRCAEREHAPRCGERRRRLRTR